MKLKSIHLCNVILCDCMASILWMGLHRGGGPGVKYFPLTPDTHIQNTHQPHEERKKAQVKKHNSRAESKGYVHVGCVFSQHGEGGCARACVCVCVKEKEKEWEQQNWQCTRGSVYWRDQNREPSPAQPRQQQREGSVHENSQTICVRPCVRVCV